MDGHVIHNDPVPAAHTNDKSSLLLSFKKEESSFLKKRSKRLLFMGGRLLGQQPLCDAGDTAQGDADP
jgi:hypothetical protein